VHLATWSPSTLQRSDAEHTAWVRLFEIRERVLPFLEKERQSKTIGKSLDAKLTLRGSNPMLSDAKAHTEALRELLNVSQLEIHVESGEVEFDVEVLKAGGRKCERCWHWEEDVGREPEHPTICGRCLEAVRRRE
jgi:isoleucyl-tRNA synthetase